MGRESMERIARNLLLAITLLGLSACVEMEHEKPAPLEVVESVDLTRYVGKWYEIARYPNRFQKACVDSRATYALRDDGRIDVVNECTDRETGRTRQAKGKAWVVDKATNAKLKVSFFWPFAGDYWIIELEKDYRHVVIGHPQRKYLWILCREKEMDGEVYRGILSRLEERGYDTARLIKGGGQD